MLLDDLCYIQVEESGEGEKSTANLGLNILVRDTSNIGLIDRLVDIFIGGGVYPPQSKLTDKEDSFVFCLYPSH